MRISDAIALGSTIIQPLQGTILNSDRTKGCAWGMMQMAAPQEYCAMQLNAQAQMVNLPCACSRAGCNNLAASIIHLFDHHVMTVEDMTLEQLIDWVRTVEPEPVAEPEPAPTLPVEPEPETEPEEECEIQECTVAHS